MLHVDLKQKILLHLFHLFCSVSNVEFNKGLCVTGQCNSNPHVTYVTEPHACMYFKFKKFPCQPVDSSGQWPYPSMFFSALGVKHSIYNSKIFS